MAGQCPGHQAVELLHRTRGPDAAAVRERVNSFAWPGGWWLDPVIGLAIAAVSAWEGAESWRGDECGC